MFPKRRKSEMNLVEVGGQLAAQKKELMAQMKAAAKAIEAISHSSDRSLA